jgi:hypothetical protein
MNSGGASLQKRKQDVCVDQKDLPIIKNVMQKLLSSVPRSLDDKVVVVKIAHSVDKGCFETAFKTLMKR